MARKSLFDLIENAAKEDKDYADSFLTDLEYHIKKLEKDNQRVPSKTFKPSSIRCPRCAVMQVLGCPANQETRNSNLIGITSAGSFIHEMIQSKIVTMPNWEYVDVSTFIKDDTITITEPSDFLNGKYETKLHSTKWNMNFLVDGIIKNKDKVFILEIKSISGSGYFKTKEVPQKYKDQAISYCALLGVRDVMFLFVDRDLFNMKTFLFSPSAQDLLNWEQTMKYNMECVAQKTIPPKPRHANRAFCQYCSYSEYCDTIGVDEHEFSEAV